MRKTHRVIVNGEQFTAARGEVLLDAALKNGIHIPHDCRSGHCGTCSVRIVRGQLFGSGGAATTKACQSWIISDVEIAIEDVPDIATVNGHVTAVRPLAPDVVAVSIATRQPLEFLAGQYLQVQFKGFGTRCYSPTVPVDRQGDGRSIHLHVRRVRGGRVSSALGAGIKQGHRVKLTGPFGSAFLRPNQTSRLVLVATGTGFAPIWSIADAAMRENPRREIVVVVGARSMESLYMIPALWRLAGCPNATIIPVVGSPQEPPAPIRSGSPIDHIPLLSPADVVYAAGSPKFVDALQALALQCGATFHADAFVSTPSETETSRGLLSRVVDRLMGDAQDINVPAEPQPPARVRKDVVRAAPPPRQPQRADQRSARAPRS
jgi:3-phenylpropionate/trans-cinnamate dioxygenase ferredoxin reductase subunit